MHLHVINRWVSVKGILMPEFYASAYNKPTALYENKIMKGTPMKMPMKTPIYGINPISPIKTVKAIAIR